MSEVNASNPAAPGWPPEPPASKSSWCVFRISTPMFMVCRPLTESKLARYEYPVLWLMVDDRPFPGPQLCGSHPPPLGPPKTMLGKALGCPDRPEGKAPGNCPDSRCVGKKSLAW